MFFRFLEQGNHSVSLGNTVEEVFRNLTLLGTMYSLVNEETEFSRIDVIHSVLSRVFDGVYPLNEIMLEVRVI